MRDIHSEGVLYDAVLGLSFRSEPLWKDPCGAMRLLKR
jgi:hypothetical protein